MNIIITLASQDGDTGTGAGNVGLFWQDDSIGYLKAITYEEYSNNYESGSNLCFHNTTGDSKCIRKYSYDYSGDG